MPKAWQVTGLALVAAMITGCGTAVARAPSSSVKQIGPELGSAQPIGMTGQQPGMPVQQPPQQQPQDPLNLTPDQQQKLQQLTQSVGLSGPDQASVQNLQQVLTAPQINVQVLAQLLQEQRQKMKADISKVVALYTGMRDILRPDQEATLIQLQQAPPTPAGEDPLAQFRLTPEQRAALEALMGAQQEPSTAIADFLRSGDAGALQAALAAKIDQAPEPAVIAQQLAGLSHAQRQQIFQMAPGPEGPQGPQAPEGPRGSIRE